MMSLNDVSPNDVSPDDVFLKHVISKQLFHKSSIAQVAVLQSGELFTWGSADCGKLGVGAAMTSGTVGLPRQVPLAEQINRAKN